jgi:hypothetical protein
LHETRASQVLARVCFPFMHGLYSDPITWVDTAKDLRAMGW